MEDTSPVDVNDHSEFEAACAFKQKLFYKFGSMTVVVLVMLSTLFGNVLILRTLYKFSRHFKASLYIFIGNLAVADFILGVMLLLFPLQYIFTVLASNFYYCCLKIYIASTSSAVSFITLLFISMDRHMALMRPVHYRIMSATRKKRVKLLAVLVWIVSLAAVGTSFLTKWKDEPHTTLNGTYICHADRLLPNEFHYFSFVGIVGNVLVSLLLYLVMKLQLRRHMVEFPASRLKERAKTTMMIVVIVAFAVCWGPYATHHALLVTSEKSPAYVCLSDYLAWPAMLNSGVNWIIYGVMNRKFRRAFVALVKCQSTFS